MNRTEQKDSNYRITIKTLEGRILTFTRVKSYEIKDGHLTFTDSKTDKVLSFPSNNCEVHSV